LLWGGKPAAIVKAAEDRKVSILTSEEIIVEISHVLTYPKLEKIYRDEGLRREDWIESVIRIGKFVKVTKKVNVVREHPADDKFLDCALAAGADYVVSGDKHLLKVVCYRKTKILSVNEFLQILEAKR
jgi:putative PIN family toxin of toxin-antitoxin system